jgi:hypothetical protein
MIEMRAMTSVKKSPRSLLGHALAQHRNEQAAAGIARLNRLGLSLGRRRRSGNANHLAGEDGLKEGAHDRLHGRIGLRIKRLTASFYSSRFRRKRFKPPMRRIAG